MPRLKDACSDGSTDAREGALCAFECLSERLGLLFEPYVLQVCDTLVKEYLVNSRVIKLVGAFYPILTEKSPQMFTQINIDHPPLSPQIISPLLKSFSHASDRVRDAARHAARVIMGKLSAHGVKQVHNISTVLVGVLHMFIISC